MEIFNVNVALFFPPSSIDNFLCKMQDDTAHKVIYSCPFNLQQCILISVFLSAFARIFSCRLKISQGWGIWNSAWWHKVEKGQHICRWWPLFRQLFPARRILELVELLPGTFTSWCIAGSSLNPPTRNTSSPSHEDTRLHQPRLNFFHIPICWGVNPREHINTY